MRKKFGWWETRDSNPAARSDLELQGYKPRPHTRAVSREWSQRIDRAWVFCWFMPSHYKNDRKLSMVSATRALSRYERRWWLRGFSERTTRSSPLRSAREKSAAACPRSQRKKKKKWGVLYIFVYTRVLKGRYNGCYMCYGLLRSVTVFVTV
jgi:hypothetical protein